MVALVMGGKETGREIGNVAIGDKAGVWNSRVSGYHFPLFIYMIWPKCVGRKESVTKLPSLFCKHNHNTTGSKVCENVGPVFSMLSQARRPGGN